MLLLQAFKDMWDELPNDPNIKKYLASKNKELGSRKFCSTMLYWFGNRSYNKFLDYSLLAIKFANWYTHRVKTKNDTDDAYIICRDIVTHLLWDDRHDMWQNIPYLIDKLDVDISFYNLLAQWIIECFNVYGTGDLSVKWNLLVGIRGEDFK